MALTRYELSSKSLSVSKGSASEGTYSATLASNGTPPLGSNTEKITKIYATWTVAGSTKIFGDYDATTQLKLLKNSVVLYDSGQHKSSKVDVSDKNVTGNTTTSFSVSVTELIKQGGLSFYLYIYNHDGSYTHTITMKNMKLYIEYENYVFSFNLKVNGNNIDVIKLNGVEVDELRMNGTLISTGSGNGLSVQALMDMGIEPADNEDDRVEQLNEMGVEI